MNEEKVKWINLMVFCDVIYPGIVLSNKFADIIVKGSSQVMNNNAPF